MTTQNAYSRNFAKYASLNVLGMLALSCYILADTFFVAGGLGSDGLAALNLAIPIYSFVHGSGLMLGMGGAARYSILRGKGDPGTGDRLFTGTIFLAVCLAFVYAALGLFGSEVIARAMGGEGEVFVMANTYLKVILLFAPAFMINDVILCFVRNDGDPRLAMMGMLGGSLMNIVLDYVFIFPLQMGIFGAVLATGLAPLISLSILSVHRIKGRNGFHLRRSRMTGYEAGAVISLGISSLVAEVSSGVVIIVFNGIILGLHGNVGVAAYGVIANLSLVVTAVYTGIAQGMQPLMSSAYGRGDRKGIRTILGLGLLTAAALSFLLYGGIYMGAEQIAAVFNSEGSAQLQALAAPGLRLYFLSAVFVGINIISAMYFSATEKALPAQVISVSRGLVLIVPMAYVMSDRWGIQGVWLSFPATEATVCVLSVVMLFWKFRKRSL